MVNGNLAIKLQKAGGALALWAGAGAIDTITMRWDGTNWVEASRALNVS